MNVLTAQVVFTKSQKPMLHDATDKIVLPTPRSNLSIWALCRPNMYSVHALLGGGSGTIQR